MSERGNAVSEIVAQFVTDARRQEGLSTDELASLAGLHPAYVGLLERRARQPTLAVAASLAEALGLSLSELVAEAEQEVGNGSGADIELLPAPPRRQIDRALLGTCARLTEVTGLTGEMVARAIDYAYRKLDLVDEQMRRSGSRPIGALADTVDLSGMAADLLSAGVSRASGGLYVQNGPDHAPELLPLRQRLPELELKAAPETDRPVGGPTRAGVYLMFRYVLTGRDGSFTRGKDGRGDTVAVWEARFGELREENFLAGRAGGGARVRKDALERMELLYYDPALLPYAKATGAYAALSPR
jgi:transcriptional regulator with XRE-family HTH domain